MALDIFALPLVNTLEWSPTTVSILGVLLLIIYIGLPSAQEHAIAHLPTPSSTLPVLRNTLDMTVIHGDHLHDWIYSQCKINGGKPWRMRSLGLPVNVVVTTPEVFEDVQKTQFERFVKGRIVSEFMYDILGVGIFVVDGSLWMHQRKTSSHLFSVQNIRECMEEIVNENTHTLCQYFQTLSATPEKSVNLRRILDLFTMDVFTKIGFGVDLHGLSSNQNPEILDAFERGLENVTYRFRQPEWLWKLKRWLDIGREKQLTRDMKTINKFVFDVIERSIEEHNTKCNDGRSNKTFINDSTARKRKTLLSLFLEKSDVVYSNGKRGVTDPTILRDMSLSFLAAGRDTTSQSMGWFVLMMNRYPDVLQKIRCEITEKLPDLATGKVMVPSMEDVQQLFYLEAAIRETLRLYPIVALTMRTATEDTNLCDGTFVKAGTRVMMHHYAMARMEYVWGKDAKQYNPDRWIDPTTGKLIHVSPFKFSAFLGGPRTCLGMNFALMEMKIALAALLSKFAIKTVKDPFDFTYRVALTLSIKGSVDVTVHPLSSIA